MSLLNRFAEFFRTPRLSLICVCFALNIFPVLLTAPITPLIILRALNNDSSKAAIISGADSAVGAIIGFFACPILGMLSDKYGRKPFLVLNSIAPGFRLLGLLILYYTGSIWVIFVFNIIGSSMASIWAMSFVYVADITEIKQRSKSFGFLGASLGIAAIAGPAVAAGTGAVSLSIPIFVGLAAVAVNFVYTSLMIPESHEAHSRPLDFKTANSFASYKLLFSKPIVIGLTVGIVINLICAYGILGASVLYYQKTFGWGAFEVGLSFAVYGLIFFFAQGLLVGVAARYVGERWSIVFGILVAGLVTFPIGLIRNGWLVFVFIPIKALSSISTPMMQGIISKQFSPLLQGQLIGAVGGLTSLFTGFVGPILFSSLYSYFVSDQAPTYTPQIIFFVGGGLEFVGFLIVGLFFWKVPKQEFLLSTDESIEQIPALHVSIESGLSEDELMMKKSDVPALVPIPA